MRHALPTASLLVFAAFGAGPAAAAVISLQGSGTLSYVITSDGVDSAATAPFALDYIYDTAAGAFYGGEEGTASQYHAGGTVTARLSVGDAVYEIPAGPTAADRYAIYTSYAVGTADSQIIPDHLAFTALEQSIDYAADGSTITRNDTTDFALDLDFAPGTIEGTIFQPLDLADATVTRGVFSVFSYEAPSAFARMLLAAAATAPASGQVIQGSFVFDTLAGSVTASADATPPAPVPLPAGGTLLTGALAGLGLLQRRRGPKPRTGRGAPHRTE
ncbi:VPLPA-CTERM sorting domain-containing protein [Frigidibacter sp. MR17.24]|uniref:VPLPA-CTERM sorting domain-containing protein n=1 Tax=Frigidibacter sp. MR17.24 TaxID=3127345 RepID=UPI00301313DA